MLFYPIEFTVLGPGHRNLNETQIISCELPYPTRSLRLLLEDGGLAPIDR